MSKLDDAIAQWFKKSKAPGVVVAITIPGKGSYVVTRGKADPATGVPMSLDDPVSKYGLYSYTFDKTFIRDLFSEPHRSWTPRQLVNISIKHKPPFLPGKGWQYCNTNTVLLRMIIEKVTGRDVAYDFKTMSFAPLVPGLPAAGDSPPNCPTVSQQSSARIPGARTCTCCVQT